MIIFTEWFMDGEKPVHVGVYQANIEGNIYFQHWNGEYWGARQLTPDNAYAGRDWEGGMAADGWRGLMKRIV